VAACSGRALEVPDHAAEGGVDFSRDLDGGFDASRPPRDGGMCVAHQREAVSLTSVSLVGGGLSAPFGTSIRILVEYLLRAGCDVPADLTSDLQLGDATDVLSIHAFAWHGDDACLGALTVVRRVVIVPSQPGENGILAVRDPMGSTTLLVTRFGATSPSCTPVDVGQACVSDCGCLAKDPSARCLTLQSGARACGRSCSEDPDCPADGSLCVPGDYRCMFAEMCRDAASCPVGQRVSSCRCEPFAGAGGPCSCDADCSADTVCNGSFCIQPCVTGADCAPACSGEGCGSCVDGVCVYTV
jgi:hypothetical protein